MTFDIYARNFRSFSDFSILSMGVSAETLRKWKSFQESYQKQGHFWSSPVEEMIVSYFFAYPDERPLSMITVAELKR